MFIDTHCHLNIIVKDTFDTPLASSDLGPIESLINQAEKYHVTTIINVGTSLIESINCVVLATSFPSCLAVVGIHPNDATESWASDFREIKKLVINKEKNRIVGLGECGIDRHYPDYNLRRQEDVFRAHIDLALEHDLAIIIHSRDAADETLAVLDAYKNTPLRGIMHCYSYDLSYAQEVITRNFVLGVGGTITYPKNSILRDVVTTLPLTSFVLETDAPYLPPQHIRGKKNSPEQIAFIADYIAHLVGNQVQEIARVTTETAKKILRLP